MSLTTEHPSLHTPEQESMLHGVKDKEITLRAGDLYHLDSSVEVGNGADVLAYVVLNKTLDGDRDDIDAPDELAVIDMRNARRDSQGAKMFSDHLIDQNVEFLVIDPKQLDWETGKGFKGLRKGEEFTFGRPVEGQTPAGDPKWRFEKTSTMTSRNHVSFKVDDLGEIYVQDENSANGTFLSTGLAAHERMSPLSEAEEKNVPRVRVDAALNRSADKLTNTQQAEGIILDEESIAHFVETASNPSQPELTRSLISIDALKPKTALTIDNNEFYFSQVFTTGGGMRKHILGYVKNGQEEKLSPRLFYKSFSDGGWRSTPYLRDDGIYSKGKSTEAGGYVQETKPVESVGQMLEAIDQNPSVADTTHENLMSLFNIDRQMQNDVFDYNDQVNSVKLSDQWATVLYDNYEPGMGFVQEASVARSSLEKMQLPEGFEPDFTQTPKNKYVVNHTIAGKVEISVYSANYNGQNIEWHVAEDTEGKVWLDKVALENSGTTTYGTSKNVLRLGALSAKPFEYLSQVKGMVPGEDYEPVQGSKYVDLRQKYWGKMAWVQRYKESKN